MSAASVTEDAVERHEPTLEQIKRLSAEYDLPVVVPRELPGSYEWIDQLEVEAVGDGKARSRTFIYLDRYTEVTARTCVTRRAAACPSGSTTDLRLTSGQYIVVVHFVPSSSASDLDAWRSVQFTDDPTEVAWLG